MVLQVTGGGRLSRSGPTRLVTQELTVLIDHNTMTGIIGASTLPRVLAPFSESILVQTNTCGLSTRSPRGEDIRAPKSAAASKRSSSRRLKYYSFQHDPEHRRARLLTSHHRREFVYNSVSVASKYTRICDIAHATMSWILLFPSIICDDLDVAASLVY